MLFSSEQSTFKGNSCFVARSVSDIVNILRVAPAYPFWARGEAKEFDLPCLPTICRNDHHYTDSTPANGFGSLTNGEVNVIEACKDDYLSGKLQDELFARFLGTGNIDYKTNDLLYWAALAQHHNHDQIYPTRLLDVTSDILVATYFACNKYNDSDGYVFYGDFSKNDLAIGGRVKTDGSFFDIVEIEDPNFPIDGWKPSERTLTLAPLPFPNRRMTVQRGALVWARNPSGGYFNQIRQLIIKIPAECKKEMLFLLKVMGYSEDTLFPKELPEISSIYRTQFKS
jgi:hypothetical protein